MSSTEPNLQVFCCRPVTNLVIQQCQDRDDRLCADGLFSAVAGVEVLVTKLLFLESEVSECSGSMGPTDRFPALSPRIVNRPQEEA